MFNYKEAPIQRMLDFDYLCKRTIPSVAAVVSPGSEGTLYVNRYYLFLCLLKYLSFRLSYLLSYFKLISLSHYSLCFSSYFPFPASYPSGYCHIHGFLSLPVTLLSLLSLILLYFSIIFLSSLRLSFLFLPLDCTYWYVAGTTKAFFGTREIVIRMFSNTIAAAEANPAADVFINFASFRSAYTSSMQVCTSLITCQKLKFRKWQRYFFFEVQQSNVTFRLYKSLLSV